MANVEVIVVHTPPPTRVIGRFTDEALQSLQAALGAAQQGTLTSPQASEAIGLLNEFVALTDTEAMRAGIEPEEILAQAHTDAAGPEYTFGSVAAAAALGTLTRAAAEAGIVSIGAAIRSGRAFRALHTLKFDAGDRASATARKDMFKEDSRNPGKFVHFDVTNARERAALAAEAPGNARATQRRLDYEEGRRAAEAASAEGRLGRRQPEPWERPLVATTSSPASRAHLDAADRAPWLRPLSEVAQSALSRDTAQAKQQRRQHLDAEDAATAHRRELDRLHAPIREREKRLRNLAVGAPYVADGYRADAAESDEIEPITEAEIAEALKELRSRAPRPHFDAQRGIGTQPWKRPLQMTSEGQPDTLSGARSFRSFSDGRRGQRSAEANDKCPDCGLTMSEGACPECDDAGAGAA